MARRRLTVRRIDPWSVLKFGAVVNTAMFGIGMLVLAVVFFIVDRLGLIDQVCGIALDVGFTACGLNVGNLFRALTLLGLLGVVILTAVLVFLSFLHNLIADLTGGLTFTVVDDTPAVGRPAGGQVSTTGARGPRGAPATRTSSSTVATPPVPPIGRGGAGGNEHPADRERDTVDRAGAARTTDEGELFRGR